MTAIDFPNSPSINDVYSVGTRSWRWTGAVWQTVTTQVGSQGDKGGIRYNFDSSIVMSEPATGKIRFNNSTPSSITSLAVSSSSIEGFDASGYFVDMFDSSEGASSAIKNYMVINSNTNNSDTYAIFGITYYQDNGDWVELSVVYISGTLPDNNEPLVISLSKVGDLGPTGPTGPGGTYSYQVSPTAPEGVNPEGPDDGDTWFNAETGRFYIYYDGYWIENTSSLTGQQGPAGEIANLNVTSPIVYDSETATLGFDDSDYATIEYVDNVATGIIAKPAVRAATTTNLSAIYDNGVDGVGATLTADTNRAFTTLDGVTGWSVTTPPMGILVKNQTNKAHNGRYNLTSLGSESTPWVLTKCGLCDEADEIPGAYVFVQNGTANKGTGWIQVVANPDTFVVGTDNIDVFQFSGVGTYTAGNGLTLTGTSFAIDEAVVATQTDLDLKLDLNSSGNAIINGAFDIWQRGTSGTAGLVYGADRWIGFGTSPNSAINTDTPSATFKSSNNVFGSTNTGIQQRIESSNSSLLVNQAVTVSFWARNYSSSGQFRVSLDYANTINNFSSITNISSSSSATIAPSGSVWNRYSFTFNALPNQVSNGLAVTINLTGTSSVGFLITGVQLEAGSVATPFKRNAPSLQAELAACQRYFQKSHNANVDPVGGVTVIFPAFANIANNSYYGKITLPTAMRAAPTVVVTSVSGNLTQATNDGGADYGVNSANVAIVTENGFNVRNTSGSTLSVVNNSIIINYTASSEL